MSILHRPARKSSRPALKATPRRPFGVGIFEPEAPAVEPGRQLTAEQAASGSGMTFEESCTINAAGHDARFKIVCEYHRNGGELDVEDIDLAIDRAIKTARLDAATAIVETSPRSLLPRRPLPAVATPAVAREECQEADNDAGDVEADPADWPAWTDEVWTTTEEPSFADELVKAVGTRRAAIVEPVDAAWYNGFRLGESGYEVHQVAPPSHYTPAERTAFVAGLATASAERWADYERHMDRMEALDRLSGLPELHAGEFMEARMTPC